MTTTPLLEQLLVLLSNWQRVFRQERSFQRALRLALAHILTPGQRLLSRLIATSGRQDRDWTADYKLFNRSPWQVDPLFFPMVERCVEHCKEQSHLVVAGDFTHLVKSGKHIANVSCMRDPMSPPYHVNLIQGLRFFQLAAILPLYRQGDQTSPPRSVPVCFSEVPVLKKPGRKATEPQRLAYQAAYKSRPASQKALQQIKALRSQFDLAGADDKTLLVALDGSFCNGVFLREELDRIELLCRCRKDARLRLAAQKASDASMLPRASPPNRSAKIPTSLGSRARFITVELGAACALKNYPLFIGQREPSDGLCAFWSLLPSLTVIIRRERLFTAKRLIC